MNESPASLQKRNFFDNDAGEKTKSFLIVLDKIAWCLSLAWRGVLCKKFNCNVKWRRKSMINLNAQDRFLFPRKLKINEHIFRAKQQQKFFFDKAICLIYAEASDRNWEGI